MCSLLMKTRVLFTITLVLDDGLNPKCMLDFKIFYKNDKYKCALLATVLTLGLWKFVLCVGSPDCVLWNYVCARQI